MLHPHHIGYLSRACDFEISNSETNKGIALRRVFFFFQNSLVGEKMEHSFVYFKFKK